jgi:hypothetical protein
VNDNAEIVRLLTEIRDLASQEAISRKKMVEESLRLQRLSVRRQMIGLVIIALIIGGTILAVLIANLSSQPH